jgi:hypothetical protein
MHTNLLSLIFMEIIRFRTLIILLFVFLFLYSTKVHALSYESVVWKINPEQESDFIRIAEPYIWWNKDKILWMRREWYYAFVLMANEAKKQWIDLEIVSARRSYDEQIPLFIEYWLERALPPGTSSHHYWHAIDLAGVNSWWKTEQWLQSHAYRFWFCQSYDWTSSGQWEEPRHYEFDPWWFRHYLAQYRDTLYLELTTSNVVNPWTIDKKTLFDTYVYPYSHRCIDGYPSRIDDVISGIRFERYLDSNEPDHLVYTLSRYKQARWTWLLALLPNEIRFTKTWSTVQFTPVQLYPVHLQKAFQYNERFRIWLERLVLTRIKAQLMQYDENTE